MKPYMKPHATHRALPSTEGQWEFGHYDKDHALQGGLLNLRRCEDGTLLVGIFRADDKVYVTSSAPIGGCVVMGHNHADALLSYIESLCEEIAILKGGAQRGPLPRYKPVMKDEAMGALVKGREAARKERE